MNKEKLKILLRSEGSVGEQNRDMLVNLDLKRTFDEFKKQRIDNEFDVAQQFREERNSSRNFRIYGIIDSIFFNTDNIDLFLLNEDPISKKEIYSDSSIILFNNTFKVTYNVKGDYQIGDKVLIKQQFPLFEGYDGIKEVIGFTNNGIIVDQSFNLNSPAPSSNGFIYNLKNSFIKNINTTPLSFDQKNIFNKKRGKYFIELDEFKKDKVFIFIPSDLTRHKDVLLKQQLVYRDTDGNFIEYGTQTIDFNEDGEAQEINNDFPFFYNRHWIKNNFQIEEEKPALLTFKTLESIIEENEDTSIIFGLDKPSPFGKEKAGIFISNKTVNNNEFDVFSNNNSIKNGLLNSSIDFKWDFGEQDKEIVFSAKPDSSVELNERVSFSFSGLQSVEAGQETGSTVIIQDITPRRRATLDLGNIFSNRIPFTGRTFETTNSLIQPNLTVQNDRLFHSPSVLRNGLFFDGKQSEFYPIDNYKIKIINKGNDTIIPSNPNSGILSDTELKENESASFDIEQSYSGSSKQVVEVNFDAFNSFVDFSSTDYAQANDQNVNGAYVSSGNTTLSINGVALEGADNLSTGFGLIVDEFGIGFPTFLSSIGEIDPISKPNGPQIEDHFIKNDIDKVFNVLEVNEERSIVKLEPKSVGTRLDINVLGPNNKSDINEIGFIDFISGGSDKIKIIGEENAEIEKSSCITEKNTIRLEFSANTNSADEISEEHAITSISESVLNGDNRTSFFIEPKEGTKLEEELNIIQKSGSSATTITTKFNFDGTNFEGKNGVLKIKNCPEINILEKEPFQAFDQNPLRFDLFANDNDNRFCLYDIRIKKKGYKEFSASTVNSNVEGKDNDPDVYFLISTYENILTNYDQFKQRGIYDTRVFNNIIAELDDSENPISGTKFSSLLDPKLFFWEVEDSVNVNGALLLANDLSSDFDIYTDNTYNNIDFALNKIKNLTEYGFFGAFFSKQPIQPISITSSEIFQEDTEQITLLKFQDLNSYTNNKRTFWSAGTPDLSFLFRTGNTDSWIKYERTAPSIINNDIAIVNDITRSGSGNLKEFDPYTSSNVTTQGTSLIDSIINDKNYPIQFFERDFTNNSFISNNDMSIRTSPPTNSLSSNDQLLDTIYNKFYFGQRENAFTYKNIKVDNRTIVVKSNSPGMEIKFSGINNVDMIDIVKPGREGTTTGNTANNKMGGFNLP